MIVFVNGAPFCEARLVDSCVAPNSIWVLEVTKPIGVESPLREIELGQEDTRVTVDLLKASATTRDLKIVVGLPGY